MAKENKFSLTKITLTPKACKIMCVVVTVLLLAAMIGASEVNLRGSGWHDHGSGNHSHGDDSSSSDSDDRGDSSESSDHSSGVSNSNSTDSSGSGTTSESELGGHFSSESSR